MYVTIEVKKENSKETAIMHVNKVCSSELYAEDGVAYLSVKSDKTELKDWNRISQYDKCKPERKDSLKFRNVVRMHCEDEEE